MRTKPVFGIDHLVTVDYISLLVSGD